MKLDNPEPRPCLVCGKVFTPGRSFQKYCCLKHQQVVLNLRQREKQKVRPMRSRVFLIARHCAYCGKIFQPTTHGHKFCTVRCRVDGTARRLWEERVARRMLGAVD